MQALLTRNLTVAQQLHKNLPQTFSHKRFLYGMVREIKCVKIIKTKVSLKNEKIYKLMQFKESISSSVAPCTQKLLEPAVLLANNIFLLVLCNKTKILVKSKMSSFKLLNVHYIIMQV